MTNAQPETSVESREFSHGVKPPTLRDLQKAKTRQRLLDSAYTLFEAQGYSATTIEQVAVGAGISRVGFYLHFTSMFALAVELIAPVESDFFDQYRRLDELDPTIDRIREWSRGTVEMWRRHAVRIQMWEYALTVDPEAREQSAASIETISRLMPRYLEKWSSAPSVGLLRLTAMFFQHERLAYFTVADDIHPDEEALIEVLSEDCWVLLHQAPGSMGPSFS